MTSTRAVFLDRDGVINESIVRDGKPYAPVSDSEFVIIEGVQSALNRLKVSGFLNIVVTNQPDISTGKQDWKRLTSWHELLLSELSIDSVRVCTHVSTDNCSCRKPATGMISDAVLDYNINLANSFMVGDRWSDVQAGQDAGCKEIFFIDYGYQERPPSPPYTRVASLIDAADLILR